MQGILTPILCLVFFKETQKQRHIRFAIALFPRGSARSKEQVFVVHLTFKERGACAIRKLRNILPSSTDSDLEAFSHNRSHVSFAALPFQATANTNDAIKRFLSY